MHLKEGKKGLYESQEANERVFMSLKRLSKAFSEKETKLPVHNLCIFYEWSSKYGHFLMHMSLNVHV